MLALNAFGFLISASIEKYDYNVKYISTDYTILNLNSAKWFKVCFLEIQ